MSECDTLCRSAPLRMHASRAKPGLARAFHELGQSSGNSTSLAAARHCHVGQAFSVTGGDIFKLKIDAEVAGWSCGRRGGRGSQHHCAGDDIVGCEVWTTVGLDGRGLYCRP